jgi:hypothetical protein
VPDDTQVEPSDAVAPTTASKKRKPKTKKKKQPTQEAAHAAEQVVVELKPDFTTLPAPSANCAAKTEPTSDTGMALDKMASPATPDTQPATAAASKVSLSKKGEAAAAAAPLSLPLRKTSTTTADHRSRESARALSANGGGGGGELKKKYEEQEQQQTEEKDANVTLAAKRGKAAGVDPVKETGPESALEEEEDPGGGCTFRSTLRTFDLSDQFIQQTPGSGCNLCTLDMSDQFTHDHMLLRVKMEKNNDGAMSIKQAWWYYNMTWNHKEQDSSINLTMLNQTTRDFLGMVLKRKVDARGVEYMFKRELMEIFNTVGMVGCDEVTKYTELRLTTSPFSPLDTFVLEFKDTVWINADDLPLLKNA